MRDGDQDAPGNLACHESGVVPRGRVSDFAIPPSPSSLSLEIGFDEDWGVPEPTTLAGPDYPEAVLKQACTDVVAEARSQYEDAFALVAELRGDIGRSK